jgi:hypothetical protein
MTKKQQDSNRKTRSHVIKDLPLRDGDAANVTGGRDPATGLPTGKRQHKPITLTVEPPILPK